MILLNNLHKIKIIEFESNIAKLNKTFNRNFETTIYIFLNFYKEIIQILVNKFSGLQNIYLKFLKKLDVHF